MVTAPKSDSALQWDVSERDGTTLVVLKGELNERANLSELSEKLSGPILIDSYDLQRINSVGVREWVTFMRALNKCDSITLLRCSPAVVAQLNSVYNFRGSAQIKSVVAPFYCAKCDAEQYHVIAIPERLNTPAELVSNAAPCAKCGNELEFDDLPDRYFLFLHNV